MMEEKLLSLGKCSAIAMGGQEAPCFGLLKILFLEHHLTTKPTMMQKGIITFNSIYLTKVT